MVNSFDELDDAIHIDFLIVPHCHVASIWTEEKTSVLHLGGHPFHMIGIHCVVLRSNR